MSTFDSQQLNNGPFDERGSMFYHLGQGIRDYAQQPHAVTDAIGNVLNAGPLPGGLLGAAIGAGVGGLAGIPSRRSKRMATIAALIGGGLGTYAGLARQPEHYAASSVPQVDATKAASSRMPNPFDDPKGQIVDALKDDPSLGVYQKMEMMAQVAQLPDSQAIHLAAAIPMVAGAGIGALVARFLFGAGALGMSLGAGLGAMAGNAFCGSRQRDAMGNQMDPTRYF